MYDWVPLASAASNRSNHNGTQSHRAGRDSRLFRQVAVVVDPEQRIRAVVAQPESGATLAALKQHAQQWLPEYLQPDVWAELPDLPRASNGKVDRQALLDLPKWLTDGYVSYAAENWSTELDDQLKSAMLSGTYKNFKINQP